MEDCMTIPENTLILGQDHYYSKDCYKTYRNNNVLVVGVSGCGKTRSIVRPNLLQADTSYIVSDPKGNLANDFGPYLQSKGYTVKVMDFIHPEKSLRFNPIIQCRTTTDIIHLANTLVFQLDGGSGKTIDPFWDESTMILFSAIIGYMLETSELSDSEKTLSSLAKLIAESNRAENAEHVTFESQSLKRETLQDRMERHHSIMRRAGSDSWAYQRYKEYEVAPDKTHDCITISALAKLCMFDSYELRNMLSGNDLDIPSIGKRKTAVFVTVSDSDRSRDILVNLFYTQLINELCSYADEHCEGSRYPIPVQFILDDFATNTRIDNFENTISNIRSRNISTMLMVQSEAQLYDGYGNSAQTIIDNCDNYVYMGGSNPEQAEKIAKRANKPMHQIMEMPINHSWIFRRGEKALLSDNFQLEILERQKGFVKGKAALYLTREEQMEQQKQEAIACFGWNRDRIQKVKAPKQIPFDLIHIG